MSIWNAVLLGLVHGIAEFFPVSSTGHASIINNLFNFTPLEQGHMLFLAMLRLATLIALLIVYWNDIVYMAAEALSLINVGPLAGRSDLRYSGVRLLMMLLIASLPMLLILPIRKQMEVLNYKDIFIGVSIILTGAMLFTAGKMTPGKKSGRGITMLDALIIGFCQCAGMIPGLSRVATTVTAGIATGLNKNFALRFSLLLYIPVVFISFFINLIGGFIAGVDWTAMPAYLIGTAVALISSIVSIYILRLICSSGKFSRFAYYCWVVGVLGIILSMIF